MNNTLAVPWRTFMEIKQHHKHPHSPAYNLLLQAGPRLKLLHQVHAHVIVSGYGCSRFLLTKLLNLACAAGSISYTRQIFLIVPNPDSFLFTSLIRSTSKFHSFSVYSLYFYTRMVLSNVAPSNYTLTSVIKSCADLVALRHGRIIHGHGLVNGFGSDVYVQTALVSFYGKCGDLCNARKVFDKMRDRSVVTWNSMISGYEQNGFAKEAIRLFDRMKEIGVEPNSATFVSVLSACAHLGAFVLGCWVHEYAVGNGLDLNVVLGTSLINMYTRCGNVSKAREVFDSMKERNVVAWTAMISGYGTNGYGSQAVELFHEMRRNGLLPNSITFVAVLSACAHGGLVNEGRRVFESMREEYRLVPEVEHHVCLVDMLGRAGLLDEAYNFIKEIHEDPAPAIWTAMLGACKMHKNFGLGAQVAEHLLASEPENPAHYVTLSNIYALAGRMDQVEMVRDNMIRKCLKKQVGYNQLTRKCREARYVTVSDSVMHELEEGEREFALGYHGEKLVIAFGLLKTSRGTVIRIVKNLRMCEDRHSAIKYISVISNREIIVRDKLLFHHFKNGSCSCLDYW
ncbi:hypothetical protein POTOM_015092 [Populus tomentosa]|uniref:DYW domain-containing protein n=1 Tax=Populus tomentosa TaxID=118781 RepID=A0A8X8D5U1_POPTO|nr:hypothetical protein POTOM_015092 [Populus tomentosa]